MYCVNVPVKRNFEINYLEKTLSKAENSFGTNYRTCSVMKELFVFICAALYMM